MFALCPRVVIEILLGALISLLPEFRDELINNRLFAVIAQIGLVTLFFEAGLGASRTSIKQNAATAGLLALLGVCLSVLLGSGTSVILQIGSSALANWFIGGALAATSVGISIRVWRDRGLLASESAQLIVKTAFIDDVLALLLLGGFAIALLARAGSEAQPQSAVLSQALSACLGIGFYILGVVISQQLSARTTLKLNRLSAWLTPFFFVRIGSQADLASIRTDHFWRNSFALLVAAVLAKILASYFTFRWLERNNRAQPVNWLQIGVGLLPRGEVTLVFASMGAAILPESAFASLLFVVLFTSLVTPIATHFLIDSSRHSVG